MQGRAARRNYVTPQVDDDHEVKMTLAVVRALEAQADTQRIITSALRRVLEQQIASAACSRVASEAGSDDAALRLDELADEAPEAAAAGSGEPRRPPSQQAGTSRVGPGAPAGGAPLATNVGSPWTKELERACADAAAESRCALASRAPSTLSWRAPSPAPSTAPSTAPSAAPRADATSTTCGQLAAKRVYLPHEEHAAVIVAWCDALSSRLGGSQQSLTFEFLLLFPRDSAAQRALSQLPKAHAYRPVHAFVARVVQRCNELDGAKARLSAVCEWGDAGCGSWRGRRRRTQTKVPRVEVAVDGDKTEQMGEFWEKMRDVARHMRREFEDGDAAARKALFGDPWRVRCAQ